MLSRKNLSVLVITILVLATMLTSLPIAAQGDLNGGGPVIRIHNTSGTIQIRKRVE